MGNSGSNWFIKWVYGSNQFIMLLKWINKVLNEDSYKHKFWHKLTKTNRIVMDKTVCHSYKKTNYHKFFCFSYLNTSNWINLYQIFY